MSQPAYNETEKSPTALAIITEPGAISPEQQMASAEKVCKILKKYLSRKPRKVVINGLRYPEADDWNLVAAFFGYTARVDRTTEMRSFDNEQIVGYVAKADLIRDSDGVAISGAEAQCSRDEKKWEKRDSFQLRSMAQTRACAKAIKNKFAWVMVLAGLTATPAEEMSNGDLPAAICSECGFDLQTEDEVYQSRKTYGKTLCKVCQKKATPLNPQVQNGQVKLAHVLSKPPANEFKHHASQCEECGTVLTGRSEVYESRKKHGHTLCATHREQVDRMAGEDQPNFVRNGHPVQTVKPMRKSEAGD